MYVFVFAFIFWFVFVFDFVFVFAFGPGLWLNKVSQRLWFPWEKLPPRHPLPQSSPPLQWALKDLKIRDIYGSPISVLFCYCVYPRTKNKKHFKDIQTKRLVRNNFPLFESSNPEEKLNNPEEIILLARSKRSSSNPEDVSNVLEIERK